MNDYKEQEKFFESVGKIQDAYIQIYMSETRALSEQKAENLLYDITYGLLKDIMGLIDGYGDFPDYLDIVNVKTGKRLKKPFVEFHNSICDYIVLMKNEKKNQIEKNIEKYSAYQQCFFECIAKIQKEQVQKAFLEYQKNKDVESMLYKVTYNIIVGFMRILDGNSEFGSDVMDIIDRKTGIKFREYMNENMEDTVCKYIKTENNKAVDDLILLLLKKCKKIYCEEKEACEKDEYRKCRDVLEYAVVTYYKTINDGLIYKLSEPLKMWKIDKEKIEETDLDTKPINTQHSGGLFKVGRFSFYIGLKDKKVIFEFSLGPRYGRGYSCDIEMSNNKYVLKNTRILWVS